MNGECGATIRELNAARFLHSRTKGGGLLRYAYPANVVSLIISDVPGDHIETIASGPTSDPPEMYFIGSVRQKYESICRLPSIESKGEKSPKSSAENFIILKNSDFLGSIREGLRSTGGPVLELGSGISGSTDAVSEMIASNIMDYYWLKEGPFFFIGGGKTLTVVRNHSRGSGNLELCLKFMLRINRNERFSFGGFDTDGIDGLSKAM